MQELGQLLLIVTFFVTLATALTAAAGAVTRNLSLMRGARYGLYAATTLYVAMAAVLTHGFLTHDFSNKYIATYSDRSMPTMYLLAAFWGGEKGALLFWTTSLSLFSAIAVHVNRRRDPVYMSWVVSLLMLAVFFFDVLMVFESNPFETFLTSGGPEDGKGLNPLLQNPTMAFHPPSLLTGYITFTIPFAFGMAAMISGRLDDQWISDTRRWTLVSWGFLSVGLVLGALWAYEELGWGFWWMWDPVENAGFVPWCTATAFLHSVMIQERRGMFKRWNVVLVCLTFFLTIVGTFLTRSQLIDSIHAFADSTLAEYFLYYLAVLAAVSAIVVGWRWRALEGESRIESFWSRESFFVLNNVVLVFCAAIILYGTVYPKMSEAPGFQAFQNQIASVWNATLGALVGEMDMLEQGVTLGEDWFNTVMPPFGVALLVLMGTGPLISWRRATVTNFRKNFRGPLVGASLVTAIGVVAISYMSVQDIQEAYGLGAWDAYRNWAGTLDISHYYSVGVYLFGVFVTWTVFREFHRGTRIRLRKGGGGYLSNLTILTLKSPRRYGGYVIHLGTVLMFLAFTGKVWKDQQPERLVAIGEGVTIQDYHVTYSAGAQYWDEAGGYSLTEATLTVLRDGQTVADDDVDQVVEWVQSQELGAFHVATELNNPKVQLRFVDEGAADRLAGDVYLAQRFVPTFDLVLESPQTRRMTWRIADQGLLAVSPQLAMQLIREARTKLGPGSVVGAEVEVTPGSPEIALTFADAGAYTGFLEATRAATVPDWLLYGRPNLATGAFEVVHASTGFQMHPEVRFFPKHQTPTTETAIRSRLLEDFYVAMRPSMGTSETINLLTVVFPLVAMLWAGAILLVFGTLLCMTPRWLAQTVTVMLRPRRREDDDLSPGPRPSGAAVAATAMLLALALAVVMASGSWAATLSSPPRAYSPPGGGDTERAVAAALTCPCPAAPGQSDLAAAQRSLADAACACERAREDRAVVTELVAPTPEVDRRSGKATLDVLLALLGQDVAWDARLRYPEARYQELLRTTKTVCQGERGTVLSQAQLSCSVRREWFPKIRAMLAAGLDDETIFRTYVDSSNADARAGGPWSYDSLRANPEGQELSWIVPGTVFFAMLGVFAVAMARISRRRRREAAAGHGAPGREAEGRAAAALSDADRLALEDALDAYEM